MTESLTITLLIVLAAATITPLISKKIKIPVIVLEIILGVIVGKSWLNLVPQHSLVEFISSFGLVYLMFLAGIEVNFKEIKHHLVETSTIAFFSTFPPFLCGFILGNYVGANPLILGTIFSTASLGLVLPISKEFKEKIIFSHILLGSVFLVDILSMFILAFVLAYIKGSLSASFIYSVIAILILFLIPWVINKGKIERKITAWLSKKELFEIEVRFSFALILFFAVISEQLGFHSIIGAFIAGLIVSELTPISSIVEKKLESFGYGFFIPLFFIFMGSKVDLPALFSNTENLLLLVMIVGVAVLSKAICVAFISLINNFRINESISMGFFHSAGLSLVIAVAEIASRLNLINNNLFSIFILLAIITAILSPVAGKYFLSRKVY